MPSSQRLGGIQRGGLKYKNKYLRFALVSPLEILSHDAMINESGIFITEAGKMPFENIQDKVIRSRRMGHPKSSG